MPDLIDPTDTPGFVAVGVASAPFAKTMVDGQKYMLQCSTAAWFAVGSNPTATKGAGSTFVSPNCPLFIICRGAATKVALIQDAAAGNASLTLVL